MTPEDAQNFTISGFDPFYFFRVADAVHSAPVKAMKYEFENGAELAVEESNWSAIQLRFLRYQATEAFFSWLPVGNAFGLYSVTDYLRHSLDEYLDAIISEKIPSKLQLTVCTTLLNWTNTVFTGSIGEENEYFSAVDLKGIQERAIFLKNRRPYNAMKHGMTAGNVGGAMRVSADNNIVDIGGDFNYFRSRVLKKARTLSVTFGTQSVDEDGDYHEILNICIALDAKKKFLTGSNKVQKPSSFSPPPLQSAEFNMRFKASRTESSSDVDE